MIFDQLFKKPYPPLDWIQVEISSYCNAECIYCPHSEYRKNWQHRHLPINVFENMKPAFAKTNLIYLQGWGEPFLHPNFFNMLQSVKNAGCMAGTTTNATLLNEKIIEKLIEERLDVIGFSLAGIDGKNDTIRKGTSLKKTLACIEALHRAKSKHGARHPKIHIAYMLLRSGLDNLEKIPAFVANTGADQTVISSLSLAVNAAMESESKLVRRKEEYAHLKHRLMEAKHASAKLGAEIHFHLVTLPSKDFHCSENVTRAMVVGSDGSVSPCVFTQIPACGQNFYYFNGEMKIQQNLSFGDIQTESISLIWHCNAHKEFLRTHLRGKMPAICRHCYKGYIDNFTKI